MPSALAAFAAAWALSDAALPLESRVLTAPPFAIADHQPENFDLTDVRYELSAPNTVEDEPTRTVFRIKKHIGIGGGYDQGVLHGSVGLYITVAEVGRWNLAVPSPAIGISRYRMFNRYQGQFTKTETTLMISLASVHFRGGYVPALKQNWYINFEQVFDARANIGGSQIGLSFSSP
jgi:hypothetical protein